MFFRRFNKKAEGGIEQVVRWLLYIGLIIAAGFAIRSVAMKFS